MILEEDDIQSLFELKELALVDKDLRSLIFDLDDLESIEELQKVYQEPDGKLDWIGEFENEPDSDTHPIFSLYRNTSKKSTFINTRHGWSLLVKDGENGQKGSYLAGGGLGGKDIQSMIDKSLSAYSPGTSGGTFSGSISANDVLVNTSSFTFISGTSAQDIFSQIDKEISTKILLGQYQTNDVIELSNSTDDIYVGKSTPDGKWYIRRVRTISSEDMEIRHANISINPTFTTYVSAINNHLILDYRLLNEIVF